MYGDHLNHCNIVNSCSSICYDFETIRGAYAWWSLNVNGSNLTGPAEITLLATDFNI